MLISHDLFFLSITLIAGFFVACGVGANDVANAMGTSVGARVLTIKQAIIIAAIFEGLGAFLASGKVIETISSGVLDLSYYHMTPNILILGMLAALLAVGVWLVLATYYGWPVSTTHSIIGALIGFALITHAPIHWSIISYIFGSWIVTPLISGLLAFILFFSVKRLILETDRPWDNANRYLPIYIFLVAVILSYVSITCCLPLLQSAWLSNHNTLFTLIFSFFITGMGLAWLKRVKKKATPNQYKIESLFGVLAIFTACAMAFAHGSNDIGNAIGPALTIIRLLNTTLNNHALPQWLSILGALGVMTGLSIYGYRIIDTVGEQITELTPSRSFAAQLATASTVMIASYTGLPVSTTQILIGGILGVGLARGIAALNLAVVRNILLSWVVTLPAGAGITCLFFMVFKSF